MLRRATAADLETLVAPARRPELARTLAFDAAERLPAALADDAGELLVIERDHAVVGGVRWTLVNRRSRIAEVRYLMVDPAAHGRGLGTCAVRELTARLFGMHGAHRAEAEVLGFNAAALRVFERAGFTREGLRRRAYDRDGAWQDGVRFGLLADELPAG